MLGSLVVSASILTASLPPLDKVALREAMRTDRGAPGVAPPAGRLFRIEVPFVNGAKRTMSTFQSPARWVYSYKRGQLELIIGLGQITPANYDRFALQGLDKLPPLQTLVFDSQEVRMETLFELDNEASLQSPLNRNSASGYTQTLGDRTKVYSFGVATPYVENGPSGLPTGFLPLNIHKIENVRQRDLQYLVKPLRLVIEGETTALGHGSSVFCGAWAGSLHAGHVNDLKLLAVDARQCFMSARLTRITVVGRKDVVLASWPRN